MHNRALALLASSILLLPGCATVLKKDHEKKQVEKNPAIIKIIEEKKDARALPYPKLADVPSKPPEGLSEIEKRMVENQLVTQKEDLESQIAQDAAFAFAERSNNLLAIASAIRIAIEKDQQIAKSIVNEPLPVIGGPEPDPDALNPAQ